ncbi:MAG: ThuA domain-containing protein [Acidobacteriota bacterium]|nr:ThuA domain-containing protein [Acidobacteriota bacterium]
MVAQESARHDEHRLRKNERNRQTQRRLSRQDHDYGLSWIRREGQGRVFYEAHGHDEKIYAIKPMLEHLLAGTQYASVI